MATSRRPARKTSSAPKVDAYQVITDQIVELLEAGTAPWHKPWDEVGGVAMSMSSKKPYRGINVLLLQVSAMAHGFGSPWWGTYKQIAERGGQVRKGEKGTQVVLWKPMWIEDEKKPGEKKQIFFLRTYTVFNANQADGDLGLPVVEARAEVERLAECEELLATYYATGPRLNFGCDGAYYTPGLDTVSMPDREVFHSSEQFYGTWFHETVHSTGHSSRLARKDLLEFHRFGDVSYSKEELVAEMGAAFLAGVTGIAAKTLPNSAAYLQNWISALKGDKKLLVQAAAQAQKAVDLILGNAASGAGSTEEEADAAPLAHAAA